MARRRTSRISPEARANNRRFREQQAAGVIDELEFRPLPRTVWYGIEEHHAEVVRIIGATSQSVQFRTLNRPGTTARLSDTDFINRYHCSPSVATEHITPGSVWRSLATNPGVSLPGERPGTERVVVIDHREGTVYGVTTNTREAQLHADLIRIGHQQETSHGGWSVEEFVMNHILMWDEQAPPEKVSVEPNDEKVEYKKKQPKKKQPKKKAEVKTGHTAWDRINNPIL